MYDCNRAILPETIDVETYWSEVRYMVDGDGKLRFPLLFKLVKGLLVLPHGNADVERIFSHVSQIKTKKRNLLHDDTINWILHAKFQDQKCYQFNPNNIALNAVKTATVSHVKKSSAATSSPLATDALTSLQTDDDIAVLDQPPAKKMKQVTLQFTTKRKRNSPAQNMMYFTGDFTVSDSEED